MPALFVLEVETQAAAKAARVRLRGPEGELLAEHRVEIGAHPPARWEGLFDTRRFVRRTARDARQVEVLLDAVGGFLGRSVLGSEITRALAAGEQRRALVVRIPGAGEDPLAAAFARIPWEIARVEGDLRTLQQRNVLVRVDTGGDEAERGEPEGSVPDSGLTSEAPGHAPRGAPCAPDAGLRSGAPASERAIRMLLVFAEPPGTRPAGARQEREELLDALHQDVLPYRDVEVDVLCHGVTRARLWEQIRQRGGYDIVHWSGRARGGALAIALEEGEEEEPLVSGAELADLFSAGERSPQLFFLSASRAGSIGSATDWASLRAALRPDAGPLAGGAAPDLAQILAAESGATAGVALALISAGVGGAVAVRHEVGPVYARGLARRFYRNLLAGEPADSALASARRELAEDPLGAAPPSLEPRPTSSLSSPSSLAAPASAQSGRAGEAGALRVAPQAAVPIAPEDHAAPLLVGGAPRFVPAARPSAQAGRRAPGGGPLLASGSKDLDPAPGFLGRGVELALLARRWLPADGAPVALLEGPPGVGKTALAAEAIQLWQGGFELVLAVQAYGWPLPPGVLLRQALRRLAAARAERHAREGLPPPEPRADVRGSGSPDGALRPEPRADVRGSGSPDGALRPEPRADVRGSGSPDGALRPEPRADVRGSGSPDEPRFDAYGRPAPLEQELAEALRSERALLVLDGLDGAACDAWAPLLDHLAVRLRGSGSRVLATTRYLAVAGAPDALLRVRLGGLPLNEAALLADRCGPLRDLLRGDGEAAALARRVLDLGRGHPLILLRLGDLAALRGGAPAASARSSGVAPQGGSTFEAPGRAPRGAPSAPSPGFSAGSRSHLRPTGRAALERGLDRLARRLDDGGSAPLEDVAAAVVDLLIELLSPGARRLLWGMTLAGEPVKAWMVEELGAMLLAPDERLRPALEELIESGLASRHAEEARGTAYGFHELVAERAAAWMARCPEEQGGASAEHVWRSYGERYAAAFRNALPMLQQGLFSASSAEPSSLPSSSTPASDPRSRPPAPSSPGPLDPRSRPPPAEIDARTPIPLRRPHELAAELGRRAVRYLVRARAFKALSSFATAAVTMVADAAPLDDVIADLAAAAEHASGEARWRTRIALADALRNARRVAEALPHYARAASEAEAAARWADVGVIRSKWADALALADRYDDARRMYEASAEAKRRAGRPRVSALAAELEALRMDVARGAAAEAEPAIRAHVDRLHGYWERRLRGEDLREAPDDAFLADTLAAALDVARRASAALERWEACLDLVDELERLGRAIGAADLDRTQVRFHRVTPLIRLGRLVEAAAVIEVCLEGFRRARELRGEARALSTLAAVRADLGDVEAAVALEREALAVRERSAGPVERAASHARLAALLHRAGVASEAAEHGLAAAAYQLASGHDPHPELRDLAARAAAAPGSPAPRLLRLAALVERPAFLTLRRSLSERGVSVEALQARLDDLFAQAVAAGEGERRPPADIEDDRVPGARSDPDPPAERAAPSSPVEGANRALPIKKSVG